MAGQSEKKLAKEKSEKMNIAFISIVVVGIISSLLTLYLNSFDILSSLFRIVLLNGINFILFKLLNTFYESMFFLPLIDFLIINCVVMIGINFHYKFWYFYLVIPGYFIYKGGQMAYNHVKGIDKGDNETQVTEPIKEKTKKKIIKY